MANDPKKKPRFGRFFFKLRILALLVFALVILLSVVEFDLSRSIPAVTKRAEARLNAIVTIGSVKLKVLPLPTVIIYDVKVTGPDGFVALARNARAEIAVIPLITGTVSVSHLMLEGADVRLKRDAAGNLNAAELGRRGSGNEDNKGATKSSINRISLKDSHIVFTDFAGGFENTFDASGVEFFMTKNHDGFTYSGSGGIVSDEISNFSLSGEATFLADSTELTGTMSLKNFKVESVTAYLRQDPLSKPVVTGKISADAAYTYSTLPSPTGTGKLKGTIAVNGITVNLPENFDNPVTVQSGSTDVEISWDGEKKAVALRNASVDLGEFNVKGRFSLARPANTVRMEISSSPIPLKSIIKYIPYKIMPESTAETLRGLTNLGGNVTIKTISFTNEGLTPEKKTDYFKAIIADVTLEDAAFSHPHFSQPLSELNGSLTIKDAEAVFSGLRGKYGKGSLDNLEATISDIAGAPRMALKATATFDTAETIEDTKRLLQNKALTNASGSGKAILEVEGSGTLPLKESPKTGKLTLNYKLDLTNAEFSIPRLIAKDPGYVLTADSTIEINREKVALKETSVTSGSSTLSITGFFSRIDPSYTITLAAKNMLIADVQPISPFLRMNEDALAKGTLSMNITKRVDKTSAYPSYTGTMNVKNAVFGTIFLRHAVRNANASVRLSGNSGTIVLKSAKFGKSDLSGEVQIKNIDKRLIELNAFSNRLDIEEFVPSKGKKIKQDPPSKKPLIGRGRITAKTGTIFGLNFGSLVADTRLTEKELNFKKIVFNSNGGNMTGYFTLMRDKYDQELFKAGISAAGVELKYLLRDFGAKEKILEGSLSLNAELTCSRNAKPFASCLNGIVGVKASDGRMMKFTTISKVFSIINVLTITELFESGSPYKRISGDFAIKNGVISTENLRYNSASIKMSAIGNVNLPKMTIDALLAV
ncbi:MAG: DUF748 domain-containing protein, partial [Deltaproteobacteria bacterium]|nr:DUF748 domain-containing protein [Deltaproteobacteria bacterium]